ncbi:hypothetical protein CKM354_000002000 [Cercospora kikuchii]|uniref:Uncharacterized protein n=1 Tax=Cercospora kikuchii TaxID=84275 RepID=A0A9P3C355_9PEZI|nr:uncharacterized protein CKM354_000002000 [Cercospora kikuchii]GIZ36549.1 hypothetical protein CKM354_000002000 [Cercospora kikuchii]
MAYWGIAYSIGPNYNKAWKLFDKEDQLISTRKANEAIFQALQLTGNATSAEQGLIRALAARFPPNNDSPDDFACFDRAYADAMRPVYQACPEDVDVAALFAEALMCMTPRSLWNLDTGEPTGDHVIEARQVIEAAFTSAKGFNHPAHCHLYIHLLEMSPFPELALPAANRLRGMVPEASHMLHMPTHIDAALGDYRRGIRSNEQAIIADDKYFAMTNNSIFYQVYRVHYVSAKLYSAMMSGRLQDSIAAADKLDKIITHELLTTTKLNMANWVEAQLGSRAHVLIRFGRWEDILRLELPADQRLYSATTAVIHYAQGIAFSALSRIQEAEESQQKFEIARSMVPSGRFNSPPVRQNDILGVASAMLAGELEYRKGNFDKAFETLREAARREDNLAYSDPPPWMQPVRHALGGLLLERGRIEEAERVFRENLGLAEDYPRRKAKLNNVWGLHGLHETLLRAGARAEAKMIQPTLDAALEFADIEVKVSCYCRLSVASNGGCCE